MERRNVVIIGYVQSATTLLTIFPSMAENENCIADYSVCSAGVAGLTTALLLSRDPKIRVVVAAKHMPGDYDIEYASPWAGANYMP